MDCEKHILLVEDDAATRDAMTLVLEMEGYRVDTAANGRDALEYLRTTDPPCLILLDLVTPVMDGWDFRKEQLQDPELADVPVVILSGTDKVEAEAASLGAAGYIHKPVEIDSLLPLVRLFVVAEPPEILVVEANKSVCDMMMTALRHHGFRVRRATSSPEAIEVYRQHQKNIALVLLDTQTPGLDARQTLTALRKINSRVHCCSINQPLSKDLLESPPLTGLHEAARMLRQMVRPV